MRTLTSAAALGLLLGYLSVGQTQPPGPPSFDELDADGNGSLSQEEVAGLFARFAGRGPGAGGPPGGGPDPATILQRWDTDGNGSVSHEEFDARPRRGGPGGPGGPGGQRGAPPPQ